jgi:hypothetical protein
MDQRSITCGCVHTRTTSGRSLRATLGAAAGLAVVVCLSAQPAPLTVERDGDHLRLSAPQFHFLAGAPLERLHDGRTVTYVFSASLQVQHGERQGPDLTRQVVFSYDLWEERFAVVRLDDPRIAATHLTATAAEAWCVDLLALPVRAAPVDRSFVVKLECSLREEDAKPVDTTSAATFTGLIDLLSRKARAAPPRWEAASLPLRLADLKDKALK